jgi:hypothetical protein
MRKWITLLVCALAVLMTVPISVLADMNLPEFEAGDQWTYSTNLEIEGLATLFGDWIFEVQGEILYSGHQVYDVSIASVDGSAYFEGVGTLSYILDGFTYLRVTDLATVKESMSMEFNTSLLGFGSYLSVFVNMTYDPPLNNFDFPLKEGDTWTTTSSTTISMDIVSSMFPSSSTSTTISTTTDFEVESKETVDVVAGKFSTYKVKATEAYGNTTYTYMSTKSGYMVKSQLYNSTGTSMGTMNLKSYSYTPASVGDGDLVSDLMDLLWLFILLIIIILVMIVGFLARRRGREKITSVDESSPSEQEFPPPGE